MTIYKNILLLLLFLVSIFSYSQQTRTANFGELTHQELTMSPFEKDPEASGVVLFEKGEYTIALVQNYVQLIKKVHIKIKVLDASKFDKSTVNIYLYIGKESREKVKKIKAVTHNGKLQTYVKKDDFYDIEEGTYLSIKRFTFPNVKDGSVLEYEYTVHSPFLFNLDSWAFQSDLPTIYSEFTSKIPSNYIYNRSLYGKQKLIINEAKNLGNCFSVPGATSVIDCEIATYVMKDIPAFKEEAYMLAKKNYISRVDFELMVYYDFNGVKNKYSKSWKDVDKEFRTDKDIGRQLNNNSYFKDKIPENILTITDDLEKAKKIYTFIQEHYTWNGVQGIFGNSRVKKAYENNTGSVNEINLSLINALQAAELDTKLVLHSTRNNGLANTSYPVIKDFNYLLAYLTIGDNNYLLDATDKEIPFNTIPFKALNVQGRIMDFKKGSYWHLIEPNPKNINYISAQLTLNEEDMITGEVNEVHTGYRAIDKRKELNNINESDYTLKKESSLSEIEISEYTNENKSNLEVPLKEKYSIEFSPEIVANKIYLFPYFLQDNFTENPFKLKERSYMVDIGYPITNTYMLSLNLNNLYEVEQLPSNKKIKLAGDAGECTVLYSYSNGKINLRFNFKLNSYRFSPDEYQGLKEFFNQVIDVLTKETIVLKKL